jgi:hypothetical protein
VEVFTGQEVGILILGAEVCANREVVFHLLHDGFGERDQSIFLELGLFDVERPLFPSVVMLEQMEGLRDPHAASGHEQDGHIQSELYEKGGFGSFHLFADGLEELIGLLGREDERHGDLFFEWRDIEQGILLKDPSSDEKTKEAPCDCEYMVHRGGRHDKIGSHVKEKGRVKRTQISSALMHIPIKDAEMVVAGPSGISQTFPIGEIVVKVWGEETLKGFHEKEPFSSDRRGWRDSFGWSGWCHGPASL